MAGLLSQFGVRSKDEMEREQQGRPAGSLLQGPNPFDKPFVPDPMPSPLMREAPTASGPGAGWGPMQPKGPGILSRINNIGRPRLDAAQASLLTPQEQERAEGGGGLLKRLGTQLKFGGLFTPGMQADYRAEQMVANKDVAQKRQDDATTREKAAQMEQARQSLVSSIDWTQPGAGQQYVAGMMQLGADPKEMGAAFKDLAPPVDRAPLAPHTVGKNLVSPTGEVLFRDETPDALSLYQRILTDQRARSETRADERAETLAKQAEDRAAAQERAVARAGAGAASREFRRVLDKRPRQSQYIDSQTREADTTAFQEALRNFRADSTATKGALDEAQATLQGLLAPAPPVTNTRQAAMAKAMQEAVAAIALLDLPEAEKIRRVEEVNARARKALGKP